jgi:hypothetical protein
MTMKSECLHIQLTENATTHIDLTFCASLTEHLPRLLPHRVRARLEKRAIDPKAIACQASATGFAPGELFRVTEGGCLLRAWLE